MTDVTLTEGDKPVKYVDLPVPHTIYMDDINALSEDVKAAQLKMNKIEDMLESKLLDANLDKTSYTILGDRKAAKKLECDSKKEPLTLYGKKVTEVSMFKFLGDFISNSLEDSIYQTVKRRVAIARLAVYEIRTVIEDRRSKCLGGINLAFDLFNASVISMVLYNSETWGSDISKRTLKVLDDLFHLFFRVIF